jgi:CHASE3 domain sensor protein
MFEAPQVTLKSPSLGRQKLVLRLAFLIMALVSALTFTSTQRLVAASERIDRTQVTLIEVNRYLSELKDVESRARGYFVTGDSRFLEGRAASIANARQSKARLGKIEVGSELRQSLDRLVLLGEERLGYSDRLVTQRATRTEALQTIRLGSDVMDQVRSEAEEIIASQVSNYRAEQKRFQRQAWLTSIALAVAVVLCIGIIAWLFAVRGREVERRRQLEEELRGLNQELDERVIERTVQLRESEERAGLIIDAALDAVIAIDDSGAITGWNPQAERIFGWTRDEVLGRPVDEIIMPER